MTMDWLERGLCAQTDPEAFYPDKNETTAAAKKVCAACEVTAECLAYALATNQRYGIWAGTSETERRRLRRAA